MILVKTKILLCLHAIEMISQFIILHEAMQKNVRGFVSYQKKENDQDVHEGLECLTKIASFILFYRANFLADGQCCKF